MQTAMLIFKLFHPDWIDFDFEEALAFGNFQSRLVLCGLKTFWNGEERGQEEKIEAAYWTI